MNFLSIQLSEPYYTILCQKVDVIILSTTRLPQMFQAIYQDWTPIMNLAMSDMII